MAKKLKMPAGYMIAGLPKGTKKKVRPKAQTIPVMKGPAKPRRAPLSRRKMKITDKVSFDRVKAPKKTTAPSTPSAGQTDKKPGTSAKEELHHGVAKGLTTMAGAMGHGKYSRIPKGVLLGAASGLQVHAAYQRYKDRSAADRTKARKTTPSQAAMAKKASTTKKAPHKPAMHPKKDLLHEKGMRKAR